MIAWYAGIQYKDSRRTFKEVNEKIAAGKLKFDGIPNIHLPDGTQMGQTMSMMRWMGLAAKGKKGECLYPGKSDPEASYRIDEIFEFSESYSSTFGVHTKEAATIDMIKKVVDEHWTTLVVAMNNWLSENQNPDFLVGNHITMADIAFGQYLLRFPLNEHLPEDWRKLYLDEVSKYPKVQNYTYKTIKPTFYAWFMA